MPKREVMKKEICNALIEMLQNKGITAEKIIILGSFARERQRRYSDIDIIVVSKDFRNKDIFEIAEVTAGINRELVRRFEKPFDIIYYSDEEWKRGYSLIINAAKQEGEVIYG